MRLRTTRGVEGEGDFVIGVPNRGALVVEVKSGAIEVAGGVWHQNGRAMNEAPREQAHRFKRTLLDALASGGGRDVWIDIATAFPETPFVDPPSQSDLRDAVLGQRDLDYLDAALDALADNLFIAPNGKRVFPPRSDRWLEVLHALWGDSWVKASRLGDRNTLRAAELVQLDAHQQEILDALADNPRLVVRGGPGTGKTLLAMEAARRHATDGRRAKIVCFTRALGAELRAEGFDACTVRELAADLLVVAGTPPASSAREEWDAPVWEAVTPQAMELVAPGGLDSCDAVIVDEAQDFTLDDWKFVRALAAKRPLWVFIDEGQAYWPDRLHLDAATEGFASYRMMEAYRTPQGLDRFAAQYRTGHTEPPLRAPIEGMRVVSVADESAIETAVVRELAAAREGGLPPARQVVLSLAGQTKTQLACARHARQDPSAQSRCVRCRSARRRRHVLAVQGSRAAARDRDRAVASRKRRTTCGCTSRSRGRRWSAWWSRRKPRSALTPGLPRRGCER